MLRIIDFEDGDRMIKSRKYRGEEDHRYICSFLDQVYNINKNQQNWLSARWEYAAYFISPLYHLMGKNEWENSLNYITRCKKHHHTAWIWILYQFTKTIRFLRSVQFGLKRKAVQVGSNRSVRILIIKGKALGKQS